jgi:hypothetical protein
MGNSGAKGGKRKKIEQMVEGTIHTVKFCFTDIFFIKSQVSDERSQGYATVIDLQRFAIANFVRFRAKFDKLDINRFEFMNEYLSFITFLLSRNKIVTAEEISTVLDASGVG